MSYVLKNIKIVDDTVYLKQNLRGFTCSLSYAAVFKDFGSAHAFKKAQRLKNFEPCITVLPVNVYFGEGQYKSSFQQMEINKFSC